MALLVTGCSAPEVGPDLADAPDRGDAATPDGQQPPGPDAGSDRAPDGGDDPHGRGGEVPACDRATVRAIDQVIGEQLEAFADGDYARALEFASEEFRAGVDAEDLEVIIEDGYPVAASAVGHETGLCVQPTPVTAEVLVEVTGRDGTTGDLVYRMVEEGPHWRIGGAIQVDGRAPSDPTTTV